MSDTPDVLLTGGSTVNGSDRTVFFMALNEKALGILAMRFGDPVRLNGKHAFFWRGRMHDIEAFLQQAGVTSEYQELSNDNSTVKEYIDLASKVYRLAVGGAEHED